MGVIYMQLPETIMNLIAGEQYITDDIGMSDSSVLIFFDKVLKIQKDNKESHNEYSIMKWLKGKLTVPEVLVYEVINGKTYLLMSKCNGKMACDKQYMKNPEKLVSLLADGLKNLWNIDINDCPSDQSLKYKLAQAEYNVKHNLVDLDNVQPDTFGENGFKNPEELLSWLYENQPDEELVLSHGDFCLPNIFFDNDNISGYIDLGKTGIADKWCDIALCYRSLSDNYAGRYNGHTYSGVDVSLLFQKIGVEPDWEKIRYYILLDELF